ncbi:MULTISPECIES: hypothetical protein [Methylobacterium]|uniref:hypothetical protein n=1 Tax=Methylobacterium TaxID=407 RepID=UPI001045CFD6|nr:MULTISPECIES: hypothetical protein [Methylobacterium]MDR7040497.1 hypothetical protein [Methylobacterium sp. BE186]
MDHELERFEAQAEDGTLHMIIAWQTFTRSGGLSGSHVLKDQRRYSLLNGAGVDWLGDDLFQVIRSGEVLRRMKR